MNLYPDDQIKINQLTEWFEQNQKNIPNANRIIHKLKKEPKLGHLVNAEFAKRFHEDGTYDVTDIEASTGTHDVDIELNKTINIQTWHGQGSAGHIMEAQFDEKGKLRNAREQNISPLGGVKTDWDNDCKVMFKKINQLPDDKLGVVLLLDRFVGVTILPEWWEKIVMSHAVLFIFLAIHK